MRCLLVSFAAVTLSSRRSCENVALVVSVVAREYCRPVCFVLPRVSRFLVWLGCSFAGWGTLAFDESQPATHRLVSAALNPPDPCAFGRLAPDAIAHGGVCWMSGGRRSGQPPEIPFCMDSHRMTSVLFLAFAHSSLLSYFNIHSPPESDILMSLLVHACCGCRVLWVRIFVHGTCASVRRVR